MKSNEKPTLRSRFRFTKLEAVIVFGFVMLWCWMYIGIRNARREAFNSTCRGHRDQIRHALDTYKDDKGSYPPLYTVDANGKPMHSWRVLILPYMLDTYGTKQFFQAYNLNEPWNGPTNIKLADQVPDYYRCVYERDANTTPFLMVSSANDPRSINMEGKNPIVLVEMNNREVNWLEPKDISITELNKIIASGKYSQHHTGSDNLGGCRYYPNHKRTGNTNDINDDRDLQN